MEKQKKNPQIMAVNKKSKYIKKIVLFSILAAFIGVVGYFIIHSFVANGHIYSDCVATDESIPTGEYQTYLKCLEEVGIKSSEARKYSLDSEPYKSRLNELTNTNLEENIVIDGNSWTLNDDNIDQLAVKNWPSTSDDINKYGEYLNGKTGFKTSEAGQIDYKFNVNKTGLYCSIAYSPIASISSCVRYGTPYLSL